MKMFSYFDEFSAALQEGQSTGNILVHGPLGSPFTKLPCSCPVIPFGDSANCKGVQCVQRSIDSARTLPQLCTVH